MDANEKFEELQAEVPDLRKMAEGVDGHLSCAESCEKLEDLFANLDEAVSSAAALLKQLKDLRSEIMEEIVRVRRAAQKSAVRS
jgi:predicted nuclease with TOPRIM domain